MGYLPYPNISGTVEEQLRQIKSYLYQLCDSLNYGILPETAEKGEENGES